MPTTDFTVSRSRIAPAMIELESTYGTDPVLVPGTDDILTYDSAIKAVPRAERFEFRPHGSSFTHQNDLMGARWVELNFKSLMMTSGTNGNVAGAKALSAAIEACCAAYSAPSGFVLHKPAAIADIQSVTCWVEHHGYVHKVNGCVGNCVMTGTPRGGVECDFSYLGLYQAPVAEGSIMNSWTGLTNYAQPFLGATCAIVDATVGTAVKVLESFRFDLGVQTERIDNACAATGTEMTLVIDRNPTLELVMAMNTSASAGITYDEWFSTWFSSGASTSDITITWGATTKQVSINFPKAEIIEVTPQVNGGHNQVRVLFKIQHTMAETEWTMTWGV